MTARHELAPSSHPGPRPKGALAFLLFAVFLCGVLGVAYPDAIGVEFVNEDYIFLEEAGPRSFLEGWSRDHAQFGWYRPWSRETHYWLVGHLFGGTPAAAHGVGILLWLAIHLLYLRIGISLLGLAPGLLAATSLALLSSWACPILWSAGSQELWFLLFALISVLGAVEALPLALRCAGVALALASKETAFVLPPVLVAIDLLIRRLPARVVARNGVVVAAIALTWFLIHPGLGPWRIPEDPAAPPADLAAMPGAFLRSALSTANLHRLPAPLHGWTDLLPGMAVLMGLLLGTKLAAAKWSRVNGSTGAPASTRVVVAGLAWAVIAWLPTSTLGTGWHSYYALFGSMGALWVLASLWQSGARWLAALPFMLAVLLLANAQSPSGDWGDAHYIRRASAFQRIARRGLLEAHPRVGRNTRFYFLHVPHNAGFISGTGPALRAWYGDGTISGGFFSDYRPRTGAEPPGSDLFFRFDSLGRWVEILGNEDRVEPAALQDPQWARDLEALASVMAKAGDWPGATRQYRKLVQAFPDSPDYAFDLGVCLHASGDTVSAARWVRAAAAMPGASPEIRAGAAMLP